MVAYESLSGSMPLQVVSKFRNLNSRTKPGSYERAHASLPLVAELEDNLDDLFYSVSLNNLLMMARMLNQDIPSSDRLRSLYCAFKDSLHTDPAFMKQVIEQMPVITARYATDDIMCIMADRDFLALLTKGVCHANA